MNGLTWFPWPAQDFHFEISGVPDAVELAVRRLIDGIFLRGGRVPDDDEILSLIASRSQIDEWKKIRSKVAAFFQIRAGHWHYHRVDVELRKAKRLHEARSLGARSTNAKRYANRTLGDQSANAERSVIDITVHNSTEQDRESPSLRSGPVSSPLRFEETSPRLAAQLFWKRSKKLVGDNGLVGRMLKAVGREKVDEAMAAIERARPSDPQSFFVACCQDRTAEVSPPSRDYAGPSEPMTDEMRERLRQRFRQYREEEIPHENPQAL